jgi:Rieske Fe-S protein
MPFFSKIHIICFVSIFSLIALNGCNKDNEHPVPNVSFYIEPIYIYDPEYTNLLNVYGTIVIPDEGYQGNGILLINLGNDSYKAYDCTCTYEVEAGCKVSPNENQINSAVCSCCGSIYELTFGTPNSGPAGYLLKEYHVIFDGEYIRIYNQ